ncbi:MAG: helix-turn-helix transcriptional regulator [Pyrinomonadaceae bacterium]
MAGKNEFPALSEKEFLIMELLQTKGSLFGLEMVELSGGGLKKGTIYVTLQRMEQKDLVSSQEEERGADETGAPRRFYSPTDYGTRIFKAQQLALRYLAMGSF